MRWLHVHRGEAPLFVAFPHTGTDIPAEIARGLRSHWLARKDTDWWIDRLYGFARSMGATTIRTTMSRTVIDVNRDPGGASLYPGQTTTGLCPTDTFDGEPLYLPGCEPDASEIEHRLVTWFLPYHAAIAAELARLKSRHEKVVLYDAHAIRSTIPRLFPGALPQFNIGTNDAKSCAPTLTQAVETVCAASTWSWVTNGRFKGGWTTRHYGRPDDGVHALQMELACAGYLAEPEDARPGTWPPLYSELRAAPLRATLTKIIKAAVTFARSEI